LEPYRNRVTPSSRLANAENGERLMILSAGDIHPGHHRLLQEKPGSLMSLQWISKDSRLIPGKHCICGA